MREPSRNISSSAAGSALHHALLNHCKKSATEMRFWDKLPMCARRSALNCLSTEFLTPTAISRRFDDLNLAEQAINQDYTCCVKDVRTTRIGVAPHVEIVASIVTQRQTTSRRGIEERKDQRRKRTITA